MAVSWNPIVDGDNERWRQAARRYTDANILLQLGSTGAASEQIEAAKIVCRTSPVPDACLQFAPETNQGAGIWGGRDEDRRRRLRRVWRESRRPARQRVTA